MISEDEGYERALQLHPELEDWEPEDYDRAEQEDGINWMFHLSIDAVVFRRASDPSLPDGGVIKELERQGRSYKDAIHMIARLVVEDIWERMRVPTRKSDKAAPGGLSTETVALMNSMTEKLNRKISALAKKK